MPFAPPVIRTTLPLSCNMDLQLKDKVVLITGGAKGIGAAIARACADEGATPSIIDRDREACEAFQSELQKRGATSELISLDLTVPENCQRAVEQTISRFGRLDVLVNNAGINDGIGLENGSPAGFISSL